jgi:hypothetical protein
MRPQHDTLSGLLHVVAPYLRPRQSGRQAHGHVLLPACKPLPLASLATLASLASLLAILLAILLITQRLIPHLRVTSHMGPKPTGGEGRVYGEVGGPSLPVGRGEAESSPYADTRRAVSIAPSAANAWRHVVVEHTIGMQ